MSLMVLPYIRSQETGKMVYIDNLVKPPFNDLFGVETWRFRVWGSRVIESLDCKILASLKKTDIYAEEKELKALEAELLRVKEELKNISPKINTDESSIEFRLENAMEAVRIAKEHPNGGVYIG